MHGNPHMQHVREPHRYLPRYSGRISRARTRQKQPNLGTPTAGPEFDPGLRQPACRERINFNEVKTQIQSRKTRRGRITKLATVLGNPHSECAENASILRRSKRKSPSQCESRKKLGSRGRPPCTGKPHMQHVREPHMQHVREPHRYLPRHSGRILRARAPVKKQPNLGPLTVNQGWIQSQCAAR